MISMPRRPLLHGIMAALGVAIRYVGVAGTAAAMIWALHQGKDWKERLGGMLLAGMPSALVLLGWGVLLETGSTSVQLPL